MWMNNQRYGNPFIYFYFKEFKAINNDTESKLFKNPFNVTPLDKKEWSESGKSRLLAPEVLTRWDLKE